MVCVIVCVCFKVRRWCVCDVLYGAVWCVCVCCFVFVCGLFKRVGFFLFVVYCLILYGVLCVLFCVCCFLFVVVWFVCDRVCDGVWLVLVDWLCTCGLNINKCVCVFCVGLYVMLCAISFVVCVALCVFGRGV